MDGEVNLPETIWLIWSREAGELFPTESYRVRGMRACRSRLLVEQSIASLTDTYGLDPKDLIPVEVRITRAQEAGS